jgi:metal-responsive CopG/Arc/MetJ family transcriptional regulator
MARQSYIDKKDKESEKMRVISINLRETTIDMLNKVAELKERSRSYITDKLLREALKQYQRENPGDFEGR